MGFYFLSLCLLSLFLFQHEITRPSEISIEALAKQAPVSLHQINFTLHSISITVQSDYQGLLNFLHLLNQHYFSLNELEITQDTHGILTTLHLSAREHA